MHRFLSMAALSLFASFSGVASAAPIAWADLIDQSVQTYEDPYRDLEYEQLDALRTVVQETMRLDSSGIDETKRAQSVAKVNDAKDALAAEGIDADWLIDQRWVVAERRERAATAVNPALDGETIVLGGFAIPAPPEADGTRIVYLVPERGMCSHTPPPNPNQMIRARLNVDWSPQMMHEPVRLTGTLIAEETRHSFRVVDGDVPMRASFVMDVTQVETVADMQSDATAVNEWAAGIAERLRASGQLPSANADATQ